MFSENDTIYWVDMGLSTISRAKRDQTWREDVVTNGIGRVEGIAVDWIAGERHLRHVKNMVYMTKIVEFKQHQSYILITLSFTFYVSISIILVCLLPCSIRRKSYCTRKQERDAQRTNTDVKKQRDTCEK